ncbi:MAG: pentapeptide repeat-containing protein [Actinomycetota bacterium]|nr:pentapeptide repeat-containing protein [Actinomycetota bacterium]
MADFIGADLIGSRFERVDLSSAELRSVDLANARFRSVDLSGVVMRGVELVDVDIYGEIENVTINGVDFGPLVNAELNRRYPDRAKMRPTDPAGFREAWDVVERLWDETVERARRLDPELLHESVGGEWSFIETLRHLVFATDSWVRRAILGDPSPWIPWTCRGTRCLTRRVCPVTATYDHRWTQSLSCAAIGCPPSAGSSSA